MNFAAVVDRVMTGAPMLLPRLARRAIARAGLAAPAISAGPEAFDQAHYEAMAGRRFRSREAALFHYLVMGSARGFEPRPGFSPEEYRKRNPDVAAMEYEPFAHFAWFGRHEGRGDAAADRYDDRSLAAPDVGHMLERPPRSGPSPRVDVIVPVHGNRLLALRTIDSVLAAKAATAFELVVVDDNSPDPDLRADLGRLAQRKLICLLANDRNLGFVQSANRGMGLHPGRDVVLLNSDTYVFDGWLDRLLEALDGAPRTATASPLSNAATILSYPVTLRDNGILPDRGFAAWDRLCGQLGHAAVEIPTAVGFCMAIKRACLEEIGAFDAERFGRGYGEENDFCLRAAAAGWRHVAATRVMVWHRGGGSFGGEKEALVEAGLATVEQLHPGYLAGVHRFIRADPLHPIRMALDIARVTRDPRPKVLQVAAQPVPDAAGSSDCVSLYLVPDIGPYAGKYRLVAPGLGALPNLPRLVWQGDPKLPELLDRLGISRVEGVGAAPSRRMGQSLADAASRLGIAWR